MSEVFSGVSSNYNALALQLNRRMTNHLQFMASYTWRTRSTTAERNYFLGHQRLAGTNGHPCRIRKFDFRRAEPICGQRRRGDAMARQRLAGYLTDGWLLAPIYSSQSGLPYSLVTSGTPSFSTTDANDTVTTFSG